ncbi:cell surface protein [Streptomyces sp. BI20]|uniref:cell surface protein n=1 Tax=Streptomyces sp. BI20 TaxID=3403460 RepID=UPI003C77225C
MTSALPRSRRRAPGRALLASAGMFGALATAVAPAVALPAPARAPSAVTATAPNPRAYVLTGPTHSVYVYDTVTGESVGGANVPNGTARIVASPDGSRLYASRSFSPASTIAAIDTATGDTVATITVGKGSDAAAVSPDGTRLYAVNRPDQTVSVVDTTTNTVTATVPVAGAEPQQAAVSPNGSEVYVAHTGGVTVIDSATATVTATIPITGTPHDITFAPDGSRAYVTNSVFSANPGLSVVDTGTRAVTGTVPLGGRSFDIVLAPDGSRAWVAHPLEKFVSVVDLAAATVTQTIAFDAKRPQRLAVTPDGGRLYVTRDSGDLGYALSTVDTATNAIDGNSWYGGNIRDVVVSTPPTPPAADLGVALTATPHPGLVGRIDYTVTATNDGPAALTSGTVTVTVPAGATSGDCQVSGTTATCDVSGLAAGASVTRHLSVPVALLSLGTPYTVTATRTASAPVDPNAANDTATRTCTALTPLLINCP